MTIHFLNPQAPEDQIFKRWGHNLDDSNNKRWSRLLVKILNSSADRGEVARKLAAIADPSQYPDTPLDIRTRAVWTLLCGSLWLPKDLYSTPLLQFCGNQPWLADQDWFIDWGQAPGNLPQFAKELALATWEEIQKVKTPTVSTTDYSRHLLMLCPFGDSQEESFNMINRVDLAFLLKDLYHLFFEQSISEYWKRFADSHIRSGLATATGDRQAGYLKTYLGSVIRMAANLHYAPVLFIEQLKFLIRYDVWGACDVVGLANLFSHLSGPDHWLLRRRLIDNAWNKVAKRPSANLEETELLLSLGQQMGTDGFLGIRDQLSQLCDASPITAPAYQPSLPTA